jgi:phage gp29-like protein
MLDAIGKGMSWTEIIWDTSEGQYRPARLEWRDPRWFRFDRDGRHPLLRGGEDGASQDEELPAFKFIRLAIKAKSGLPIRSGLARLAAWSWMFKAYTQRDWAIFTQTYGQPVRIGRYHAGATPEDRDTLFRAVANIAGDCAAIVPQEMQIEFVESSNVADGSELYEKRSDWLDRQVSKAVLGQTNTTDAQAGGLGSGQAQVHNDVREDIETADCKALSAALNRDLIRPWCDLEFGPGGPYPRVVIARPKQEDLTLLSDSLAKLVPLGLKVSQSEVRDKFGLAEPRAGEEVLRATQRCAAAGEPPIGAETGRAAVAHDPPGAMRRPSIRRADRAPAGGEGRRAGDRHGGDDRDHAREGARPRRVPDDAELGLRPARQQGVRRAARRRPGGRARRRPE